MRLFLDENFPKIARDILESEGHKVFDIRGTNNEGLADSQLFELS